jgi:PhzF family phenazine biosynthesis protein
MKIFQVDSFTNSAFKGNPAGVCILTNEKSDEWMQKTAAEMNLSETAFLSKYMDGYNLRWFTPYTEVDLCGHATLASAHILWEYQYLEKDKTAKFFTKSGILTANLRADWIELNLPSEPEEYSETPFELGQALGVDIIYIGKNRHDYLIEVESEEVVKNMKPNFHAISHVNARGIIVTSISSNEDYDFVSRFFAPQIGINEDPVTGSAHCCLGPYWKKRLNKDEFTAYQISERGGILKVKVEDKRIILSGQAVTVLEGEIIDKLAV